MIFKRPSFKRGGKPTGIESLTPRVNARFGFGFLKKGGDKLFPQKIGTSASAGGSGIESIIGSGMLETLAGGENRFPKGIRPRFPITTAVGAYGAPVAAVGGLAYLNRPRTLEEKRFMQEQGPLYETMSSDDLKAYFDERDRLSKEGDEISFTDAIFMDPDTGTYPRIFGRTEDRNKIIEAAKKKKEAQEREDADLSGIGEGKSTKVLPGETALDAVLREGKVIAEKKADEQEVPSSKDTDPGGQTVEQSFDSEFNKQVKRLEKYFGANKDEDKAMIALGLAEAIGTAGTIADKAKILNNKLIGIGLSKKKDKKEIAKLAFAAATEIEKTKIAAGTLTTQEKLIKKARDLRIKRKNNPSKFTDNDAIELKLTEEALGGGKIANINQVLPAAKTIRKNIKQYKNQLKLLDTSEGKTKDAVQAKIEELKKAILSDLTVLSEVGNVPQSTLQTLIGDDLKLFLAEGGRVMKATGDIASETPTEPVATKLTFEQLRTRLPKEITDDIVRLVATSEEALQDFSYIRTQGDVEKFNVKYGVNLVLPQDTA
jgi:hypothetical protein